MLQQSISITAIATVSPLGSKRKEILEAYKNTNHYFSVQDNDWMATLPEDVLNDVESLKLENSKYKYLDNSVLFSILSSRNAIKEASWNTNAHFGVNIGSSRGATAIFEMEHAYFLKHKKAQTLASPTTTLGNISSWVAHDLQTSGPDISHSITCSTALHAVLNGVVWLQSGKCNQFLVGGSEAPLTAFTIAQMKALKIYAKLEQQNYPCLALDFEKTQNSMILGEAAGSMCLESGLKKHRLAQITGVGFATEVLTHHVSLSADGDCFIKSMQMALKEAEMEQVDIIVTHSAGTIKGDKAELNAIQSVFKTTPYLTNNKWKIGHSLGASGLLSLEMAILMLQENTVFPVPYIQQEKPKEIRSILINAVGFGGNAVSIIIKK
ncbi:beta-ketoacyl synthase N-terminal-like domain-containing protein [Aurantibacter aestuarii]|uniref:Beta-ketoacyl synthase n=1 Tax=Aurantibacter aestuarii TaxID=1266046 RepID=A0A2T1NDM9_9FLAO|nr:beta-ketoacyl synthase N-terminal-like domain-containing protein [Aurantibacter aestuarii]PSG90552.1 beta-ketoacyl synthase [Aurantibacter aestuarii]